MAITVTETALDAIRDILTRMSRDREGNLAPLDAAVRDFARRARARNIPPERVLVSLGAVLNGPAAAGIGDWWRSVLRDRCVREAIESYYAIDIAQANPESHDPGSEDRSP